MSDKAPASYSARPDWEDVTPIAQAEEGKVLAPIFYSQECTLQLSVLALNL